MNTFDSWFASLKVTEKERIASKIAKKTVTYPECTNVWMELPLDRKESIHDHCVDAHGLIHLEWFDGNPLTD